MNCAIGSGGRAVEHVGLVILPLLRQRAYRLTRDPDLRQDLLQEAMIELWKADPTRFDLRSGDDLRYLLRILVNRMKRVRRKEWLRGRIGG